MQTPSQVNTSVQTNLTKFRREHVARLSADCKKITNMFFVPRILKQLPLKLKQAFALAVFLTKCVAFL